MSTSLIQAAWHPIGATDLRLIGQYPGTCDRCKRRDLRFVHTLEAADGRQMRVGSECARHLCLNYLPELEESRLNNRWARRSRWLTRNWRTNCKGNTTLAFKHNGEPTRVTVFKAKFDGWSYCIALSRGSSTFSTGRFASADEAKLAAFDHFAEIADS